jgi:hypothetical protein
MMSSDQHHTESEWHEKYAKDLFNRTWDYLDKTDRTVDDDDAMLQAAYGSRYHWSQIGEPVHFARGEWQISRVWSVLGKAEPAIYHAQRSLATCEANSIGDFDLAFAHEACARAFALASNTDGCKRHLALADRAGEKIVKDGDRKYFFGQLKTVPGYEGE